jgi:hypothetical protein
MKKIIILVLIVSAFACRKRNNEFSFAGVWEISKVEIVKYDSAGITSEEVIKDTAGWFAFQNATGPSGQGKMEIHYTSLAGFTTDYKVFWELDEHVSDRLVINDIFLTRERIAGGEKWSYMQANSSGSIYHRETLYVKRK